MSRSKRPDMAMPLDEGLNVYDGAEESVVDYLDKMGIDTEISAPRLKNSRTAWDGQLPSNVGNLPASEIGEWLEMVNKRASWLTTKRIEAETAMLSAKEKLKLTTAHVRKTKSGTQQQREDATVIDDRYIQANANYIEALGIHKHLQGLEEACRRDHATISRLVKVKEIEWEQSRRGDNVARPRSSDSMRAGRGGRGGRKKYDR